MSLGYLVKAGTGLVLPKAMLLYGKSGHSKKLAITFDDGPRPGNTESIITILEKYHAHATFFLSGKQVEKYPDLVRKIANAGHQVGNHGYLHMDARKAEATEYINGVLKVQTLLEDILQAPVKKIFRPPYGGISVKTFYRLARSGFQYVMWNMDSRDSFIRESSELTEFIKSNSVKSGAITLFHEDYAHTVEALPGILQIYKERGFSLCTISTLQRNDDAPA